MKDTGCKVFAGETVSALMGTRVTPFESWAEAFKEG